jgi:soluble lytic murein transglycosylase-like protein
MPLSLPQGRSRPPCVSLPATNRIALGLSAVALIAGLGFSSASRADIWGYIDDSGRSHLASEKLDRYTLFFKGGVRVGPAPTSAAASATAAATDTATADASAAGGDTNPVAESAQKPAAMPKPLPASVARFEPLINEYAKMHNLDPALVKAVIAAESAFQPGVVSAKGALGLMQIIPDTGERYGVTGDKKKSVAQKLFDPATNLKVGTRYLRDLLGMFAQNVELALAAYNAGEGSVMRYKNQVPPFAETREYVKKVQKLYADFKPAPAPVAPAQASLKPAGAAKARLLLPGQRIPNSGLIPVAADMATSVFPMTMPSTTTSMISTTGIVPTASAAASVEPTT